MRAPANPPLCDLVVKSPCSSVIPRKVESPFSTGPESQCPIPDKPGAEAPSSPPVEGRTNDLRVRCRLARQFEFGAQRLVIVEPAVEREHIALRSSHWLNVKF